MSWIPPEHDRSRELREHLPPEAWRAAIVEIARRHDLEHDGLEPFASGSDVVWAAGASVVKLTAPFWLHELEAEARCLRAVDGRLRVRTPRVEAMGELAGWPYVVMSRVPGVALGSVWPSLDARDRSRLASDLGRLVRELHALEPGDGHGEWDAFWRTWRTDVPRRHVSPEVPSALLDEIEPFLARVGELESDERVLIHTELLGEHVLAEERAGRYELASLIDFADGRIGAPDYEFAAPVEFLFRGERGLLRAFLLAYGLDAAELTPARSERMLAWALCHRFGRLKRSLAAVAPARPATLVELAQRLFDVRSI